VAASKSTKILTRRIWVLSLVSLFTDTASEMLYPVMPMYLKTIGFTIVLIGILEGMAEAVAGLSKSYFGSLSDYSGKRAPFVKLGYAFSALSKPLTALSPAIGWVFMMRTVDRLGKGIRTGARDALLSAEATSATKGRVFGFHRSMDTLGAVLGPGIALLYLYFYPGQYLKLFYFALFPGLLAVGLTFLLKDKKTAKTKVSVRPTFAESLSYWKKSPVLYRQVVAALLVFFLFNSSDIFLLIKIQEAGFSDTEVIGMYVFYNLTYAMISFPAGIFGDRFGLKKALLVGLALFSITYAGMAFSTHAWQFLILFFLYGTYAAFVEGNAKAWLSNIADPADAGKALGMFAGFQSICALFASTITGILWYNIGSGAALMVTALGAAVVLVWLSRVNPAAA